VDNGGIGETLTIANDDMNLFDDGATYFTVRDTTNNVESLFGSDSGGGIVGSMSNHNFRLFTNNAERVTITNAGNVGIATTSPWRTLSVVGTVGFSSTLGTGVGGNYLCIDTTTYEVLRGNGTACTASSLRFKENIHDLQYGLADVLKLRPVSYAYKADTNMGEGIKLGFIAEEMQGVIPEIVSLDNHGKVFGLDYPVLTAVLTRAIQELNIKLDTIATTTDIDTLLAVSGKDGFADASALVRGAVASVVHLFGESIKQIQGGLYAVVGMFDTLISDTIVVTHADIEEARIGDITTEDLCVGSVCVTEEDFLRVFGGASSGASADASGSTSNSGTDTSSGTSTATSTESETVLEDPEATEEKPVEESTEEPEMVSSAPEESAPIESAVPEESVIPETTPALPLEGG
jgi:hypothetical protein